MKSRLSLALALVASPLSADSDRSHGDASTAKAAADVAISACMPLATGAISLIGSTPDEDKEVVEGFGLAYGLPAGVFDRFSVQESGIINRAILGHREVGGDDILLAIGGQVPGCKVIVLSDDVVSTDDVSQAVTSKLGWKELPFATTRPQAKVEKRSFIYRAADKKPYLLNIINPALPDSQFELLLSLNSIPAHVQIPEGY